MSASRRSGLGTRCAYAGTAVSRAQGWFPSVSHDAFLAQELELEEYMRCLGVVRKTGFDSLSVDDQVDYFALSAQLSRAFWELRVLRPHWSDPMYYLQQSAGTRIHAWRPTIPHVCRSAALQGPYGMPSFVSRRRGQLSASKPMSCRGPFYSPTRVLCMPRGARRSADTRCGRLSAIPSVLADGRSNLERYRSVPSRFGRLALQVTHGMACSQRTRFAQGRH